MRSEGLVSFKIYYIARQWWPDHGQNFVKWPLVYSNIQDFPLILLFEYHFLTNTVQPVQGNGLKGTPHHRILFQHLIEVVHRQWVQTTVRVCSDTGCPPASRQQTNLCNRIQRKRDDNVVELNPEACKFHWNLTLLYHWRWIFVWHCPITAHQSISLSKNTGQ